MTNEQAIKVLQEECTLLRYAIMEGMPLFGVRKENQIRLLNESPLQTALVKEYVERNRAGEPE